MSPVLQPVTIGDLDLKNRVVMAPLTRSRSNTEGVPPDYAAEYYAQRANAGLIITEATNISPQAVGYALTPGIWTEAQTAAWTKIVAKVHANGGKIVMQLWHTGRISHPDVQPNGQLPVSASAIAPVGMAFTLGGMKPHVMPRALETDEIPGIVEDYRKAAANAKTAGFDGVEVHSANNYLLGTIRPRLDQQADRRIRRLGREPAAVPARGGRSGVRRLGRWPARRHSHLADHDDARRDLARQ